MFPVSVCLRGVLQQRDVLLERREILLAASDGAGKTLITGDQPAGSRALVLIAAGWQTGKQTDAWTGKHSRT